MTIPILDTIPASHVQFVFYRTETGEIVQTGICAASDLPIQIAPEGCARLQAEADFRTDYIDLGADPPAVRLRPAIESLSALPIPCTVTVRCETTGTVRRFEVDDGSFEYDDAPGRYAVEASAWPYLNARFEIEVTT